MPMSLSPRLLTTRSLAAVNFIHASLSVNMVSTKSLVMLLPIRVAPRNVLSPLTNPWPRLFTSKAILP